MKILLIGSGRFGRNHIRVLKSLADEGIIEFVGVLVRDEVKRRNIEREFCIKTFKDISISLLRQIDAVDIVTPPETHFNLVKKCLSYTNVFVEKPLAMNKRQSLILDRLAKKNKRKLFVGHIFRYHPVTKKLSTLIANRRLPDNITGSFINPILSDQGREASLELLHLFDIIDFLWKEEPNLVFARKDKRISIINLRYGSNCNANLTLGWQGDRKERTLYFKYPNYTLKADFMLNRVTVMQNGKSVIHECHSNNEPLFEELFDFISVIKNKKENNIDGKVGSRIVSIAEKAIIKCKEMPSIAVIGGGIFGTSIAAELGKFASVTIFEKNSELMREASLVNQFRHHYGYHYPRSDETVYDVQKSRQDFEKIFESALIRNIPTYYGLAKKGSLVSKKQFINFCKKHSLPFKKSFPPKAILAQEKMDLSVLVPEPSYHYERLKKITEDRLSMMGNVSIFYNTKVTGCIIKTNGEKVITYVKGNNTHKKKRFDFVINATYANINRFADWLNFEKYPIRVDLAEVLIVKLPVKPISVTVIDGPFATLMPTGNPNEFTLYHVKESILNRYVPKDGLVKKPISSKSNRRAIFNKSLSLFPILKYGKIIESRIVHRGVIAHREYDDIRIADLIEHGFGCWSVLSGKILSSVTTGKRIAEIIKESLKK